MVQPVARRPAVLGAATHTVLGAKIAVLALAAAVLGLVAELAWLALAILLRAVAGNGARCPLSSGATCSPRRAGRSC